MRGITATLFLILAAEVLPSYGSGLAPGDGQILISRDSSKDSLTYSNNKSEVRLRRDYSSGSDGTNYILDYEEKGQRRTSFQFAATPKSEGFDIVGLDVTRKFCGREIAIVTLREYTNLEGPSYSYSRIFLELTQPGKGFDYQDSNATNIGGETPIGLLDDYANIDCKTMPIELTDKSQ
ncbi:MULTISPECIES: hypothetical protein [Rhizobium/Agrobacterium group]|uniref:hypothetical protein n=1 Tax=Rhizobium/Agrobacterium group TaxID=227290 RepID=UPI000B3F8F2B|nr:MULTISPECIES: hypothetical protein [Rhizobium/Agrobacterium group]NSZ41587.1 hypothetical protein [Agrobacterium vitis]NTA25270.1 hypothetical protein [Allorhizobium ampelinum]OVE98106.1 hypothetical protein B7W85_01985 [Allorhizobium ampelinum]